MFQEIEHRREEMASRKQLDEEKRLRQALRSLKENDRNPNVYIQAARCCKQLGHLYEALGILKQGLDRCPPTPALHEYYIERLEKCNRTEEAIAVANEATLLFPNDLIFRLREALLLPIFYDSAAQVDHYRSRFTEGLNRIIREVRLETSIERMRAVEAIGKNSNKYLPYQGQDDRELQMRYGGWVHRIMTASFPHLAQPIPTPLVDGKIRVGYLSALPSRFVEMSAGKLFGGWIREYDRQKFQILAYHANRPAASAEDEVRHWGVPFSILSGHVGEMAATIRADQLHVLVYLDLSIHPVMTQLAALRLAQVQCVTWDMPLTSGLPTMDYFLSSDLMEPEDGQEQYSEGLVRLPGVGVCFTKPVIPKVMLTKKRRDFGLREESVVYLCCQSIFKYLPDQDAVVARIARQLPNSQFVFLATNEVVEADFRLRMTRAFAAMGVNAENHCVWLPEMSLLDFWNLNLFGDVSLDTLGWSGGVTTFEAVACGLPVVTLPGKLMRARHSYAILTQLGVTETIARDAEDYVDLAVRLGVDKKWRQSVIDRMVAGYPNLYSDMRAIRALEDFYRQ